MRLPSFSDFGFPWRELRDCCQCSSWSWSLLSISCKSALGIHFLMHMNELMNELMPHRHDNRWQVLDVDNISARPLCGYAEFPKYFIEAGMSSNGCKCGAQRSSHRSLRVPSIGDVALMSRWAVVYILSIITQHSVVWRKKTANAHVTRGIYYHTDKLLDVDKNAWWHLSCLSQFLVFAMIIDKNVWKCISWPGCHFSYLESEMIYCVRNAFSAILSQFLL